MRNSLTPACISICSLQPPSPALCHVATPFGFATCCPLSSNTAHSPYSLWHSPLVSSPSPPDRQTFRASGNRGLHIPSYFGRHSETGRSICRLPYTWTGGVCEPRKLSGPRVSVSWTLNTKQLDCVDLHCLYMSTKASWSPLSLTVRIPITSSLRHGATI